MIEVDISQAPKENIMNEETPQTDIEESSLKTMNYPINRRYRPRSKYYTLIHRLCSMNIFILVFLGVFSLVIPERIISFSTINHNITSKRIFYTTSHKIFFFRKKFIVITFWSYLGIVVLESFIYYLTDYLAKICESFIVFYTNINQISFHISLLLVLFIVFFMANNVNFYIEDISFMQLFYVLFLAIFILAFLKLIYKHLIHNLIDRDCINGMAECIILESFLNFFKIFQKNESRIKLEKRLNHHISCLPEDFKSFTNDEINPRTKLKIYKYFNKNIFFSEYDDLKEEDISIEHFGYSSFVKFCIKNPEYVMLFTDKIVRVPFEEVNKIKDEPIYVRNEDNESRKIDFQTEKRRISNFDDENEETDEITLLSPSTLIPSEIIFNSHNEVFIRYFTFHYKTVSINLQINLKKIFTFFSNEMFARKIKDTYNFNDRLMNIEEYYTLFKYLYNKRTVIRNNFNARYSVLKKSYTFMCLITCIFSFLCLYCGFKVEDKEIVSFLYTFFSLATLLQSFCTELYESIINIIFVHPYDVGDTIVIHLKDTQLIGTVKAINTLSTEIISYDNKVIYFYNSELRNLYILNQKRSSFLSSVIIIRVERDFDFSSLESLKDEFILFLERNKSKGYNTTITIGLADIENEDKSVIKIFYKIDNHLGNYFKILELRSEALKYLTNLLHKNKINYKHRLLRINKIQTKEE